MALTVRFPEALDRKIESFDRGVDRAFDHVRGKPTIDRLFYGASAVGDHGLIWLLLGAARGLRSDDGWHAAVRVGAGVGIESALVNIGIKSLFRRERPVHEGLRPHSLRKPRTSSFPSGHATSAFTAAALLSDRDHLKPLYYGAAVIVATSRVYVKIHHASDVVAGIAVGAALGAIGRRIYPLPSPPDRGRAPA
ncbi:MAG TPA: phosphatase PAP2 family protein [Acidimicrobiales bacterium]|nr:phosphatase PAP2 family protein [Acidimicrobiales bacterium]